MLPRGWYAFIILFIDALKLTYSNMLWIFQGSDVQEYTDSEKYYYTTRSLDARYTLSKRLTRTLNGLHYYAAPFVRN